MRLSWAKIGGRHVILDLSKIYQHLLIIANFVISAGDFTILLNHPTSSKHRAGNAKARNRKTN